MRAVIEDILTALPHSGFARNVRDDIDNIDSITSDMLAETATNRNP